MSIIEPRPKSSALEAPASQASNAPANPPPRSIQIIVASVRFLVPIAILAIAAVAAFMLVNTRPAAPRIESGQRATLVETITPTTRDERISVTGYGTVEPQQKLTVKPQVGGLVTSISSSLATGGLVSKDAILFEIDRRDFDLVVEQRRADVADAKVGLQMAEAGKLVAEREWELLGETIETTELGEQLARKEPQMREAQAMLAAAQSRLELAQLDLARTQITSPFNGLVLSESVEVGQVISPLAAVATLVGTDAFEIVASIPIEKLSLIRADANTLEENSRATVTLELGDGRAFKREATVSRVGGEVERAGRLAKVILKIQDPLALKAPGERLLLGSYVRIDIQGPEVKDVIELPRQFLHENDTIWILTAQDTLDIRTAEIVSGREDSILIRVDLAPGESIITSPLPVPIPGMPLKLLSDAMNTDETDSSSEGQSP